MSHIGTIRPNKKALTEQKSRGNNSTVFQSELLHRVLCVCAEVVAGGGGCANDCPCHVNTKRLSGIHRNETETMGGGGGGVVQKSNVTL